MDIKIEPKDEILDPSYPENVQVGSFGGNTGNDFWDDVFSVKQECIENDSKESNDTKNFDTHFLNMKSEYQTEDVETEIKNEQLDGGDEFSNRGCGSSHQKNISFETHIIKQETGRNNIFNDKSDIKPKDLAVNESPYDERTPGKSLRATESDCVSANQCPLSKLEETQTQSTDIDITCNDVKEETSQIDLKKKIEDNPNSKCQKSSVVKKPIKCIDCKFKCNYPSEFKRHRLIHTGEKPLKCGICEYTCARSYSLEQHKTTHTGIKAHTCDVCNVKFTRYSNLTAHKATHSADKPFKCEECGKEYTRLSLLVRHRVNHSDARPYECDDCNLKFAHKSNLKVHRISHANEKPFKCGICDFRSAYPNMKAHLMTHSGQKPHKCDICAKAYSQLSHLKFHKFSHSGEKPFKCDKCDYKCTHSTRFKIHVATHSSAT